MAGLKIKGDTSGSTTITAPNTGTDETIELSTALASKLDLAGGKILQIVRATDSIFRTTSSSTFVDAGISVTITPQKSNSVILLIWNARISHDNQAGLMSARITDSSDNAISGAENAVIGSSTTVDFRTQMTLIGYATPNTTSSVTYKGRYRSINGTGTSKILNDGNTGQFFAIEVSA